MASTHTLAGNIYDLTGATLGDAKNLAVNVVTNLPEKEALIDKTTNSIHLGGKRATVNTATGQFTIDLIDTSATDLNVTANTLQYEVRATYINPGGNPGQQRASWSSGWFSLTADVNLADVATNATPLAVQSASAFAQDAAESAALARSISEIDSTDTAVAAGFQIPGSQSGEYLSATFGLRQVALTGNITLSIPASAQTTGATHNIVFTQDVIGGHTVAFPPSIRMAEGASWDLSLLPGAESVAVFRYSPTFPGWVCEGCWASYVPADETGPTGGTLAATPTAATTFTATISGAADETELDAAPYALQVDDGAFTAWQTSPTFTVSGLSEGAHTLRHKTRDAAGNETLGTTVNITTIGTLAAEIAALSPAGYWKLDETSGTTATDSSGNSRNGTYSGTYTLAGQNGLVTLTNGAVTIPDNDAWSVAGSTGLSMFALYRPASGAGGSPRTIASKIEAGALEWNLQHRAGSTVAHATVFGSTGSNYMDDREATGSLTEGVWHALVTAIPTPAAGAKIDLYVDSATAKATTTGTPGASSPANGAAPLRIGNRGDVTTSPMNGALGHVAVFRSKLSAAQVNRLVLAARTEGRIP